MLEMHAGLSDFIVGPQVGQRCPQRAGTTQARVSLNCPRIRTTTPRRAGTALPYLLRIHGELRPFLLASGTTTYDNQNPPALVLACLHLCRFRRNVASRRTTHLRT